VVHDSLRKRLRLPPVAVVPGLAWVEEVVLVARPRADGTAGLETVAVVVLELELESVSESGVELVERGKVLVLGVHMVVVVRRSLPVGHMLGLVAVAGLQSE
jgi:hypothetical protein